MSKKKRQSLSSGGSRLFDAVSRLDSDDLNASRERRAVNAAGLARSRCARAQADLTGELLECRILLQSAVVESQRIPAVGSTSAVGSDEIRTEGRGKKRKVEDSSEAAADRLLAKLLEARRRLTTLSDPDEEKEHDYESLVAYDSPEDESKESGPSSLGKSLQSEYDSCRSDWKEILDRRHRDLRLHSGLAAKSSSKFRAVDRGLWEQIEATVAHERLIQATERDSEERGGYGGASADFDDSKVYQHLLREFVSLNTNSASRGGGVGAAAEAAAQRLRRSEQKKKGSAQTEKDRRASKGRKIRYTVIPKLTNFTFPVPRPEPAIPDDDWFRSLFGGAGR